jgi:two-component system, OmpR family, sensor histidine kinase CpxA
MRSLTLKIFISYWIAAALVIITFNVVGSPLHNPEFSRALNTLLRTSAVASIASYESTGCPSRAPVLDQVNTSFILATGSGSLLCGDTHDADVRDFIIDAALSTKTSRIRYVDHELFAVSVLDQAGHPYVFLMEEPYAQRGEIFGVLTPSYTTIGISGVCTFFLAFLLTRPIRRLRWAAREIAAGKLETRVDWGARSKSGVIGRHDEINGLVHDFNYMADRLQGLVAAQHLLLRDVSHELRSPLARLSVALELVREKSHENMRRDLDRIEREAARINELVAELLYLSFMETLENVTQPTVASLSEMLEDLILDATYEAQKTDRKISSSISRDCFVCGDPALIRRAIENVIRNAIHYSPRGGVVGVSLTTEQRGQGSFTIIQVVDDGPGVPEDELDSILLPFYRVDKSRNLSTGGFGIGLSIAARAIRLHSGAISARNRAGGGLTLELLLPVPVAEAVAISA